MAETEDGENGLPASVIRRPIPDPTVLTSQQSRAVEERAIAREEGLKELLLTHIHGLTDKIELLFRERDSRVDDAFRSVREAAAKAEASTNKLLEQVQTIIATNKDATYDKIGTLERSLTLIDGRLQGAERGEQTHHDNSALYIAAVSLVVAIVVAVAALVHPPALPPSSAPIITVPPVTTHG